MKKDHLSRQLAVIIHADVVGSTSLVQENEALAHKRIQAAFQHFSETISSYSGVTRELRGDALVAEFQRASDAVSAALAFQVLNKELNDKIEDDIQPHLRIGISLGEVIVADNTITGAGVVLAQRLEQLSESGGVVVQGSVSETVPIRMPFDFESLGEQILKGFDQPVRAFMVKLRPGSELPTAEIYPTPQTSETNAISLDEKPSIAVRPFINMSDDPQQEYFSDGISEDIITGLSKVSSLFVVSRNSSFSYMGRAVKTQEICADLGVRYVVEGSVRKAGSKVRITAQLVDGANGGHIWADRYDGTLDDIFVLQDQVTCQIVDALKIRLLPEEKEAIHQVPTSNIEAYDYYLKGRQLFHVLTKESLLNARDSFLMAISFDESYAQAHCGLADSLSFLVWNHGADYQSKVQAIMAAGNAIKLAPGLAHGHASLGIILAVLGEFPGAESEFNTAVQLDPNLYEAHYYWGRACVTEGRMEESAEHFETAWKLSPTDPQAPMLLQAIYRSLGRHADLEAAARETVKLGIKKLESEPDNWRSCLAIASSYSNLGKAQQSEKYIQRALINNPEDQIVKYNTACTYCIIGDFEKALMYLKEFLQQGGGHNTYIKWMTNDSDLDPIRDNPGFQELLDKYC